MRDGCAARCRCAASRAARRVSPARVAVLALSVLLASAACSLAGGHPTDGRVTLTVLAAASLREAFQGLPARYALAHPEIALTFSFDSSSAHRARIEQGAPADVFAAADTTNPQALVDERSAAGPPRTFATNALALVTPPGDPGRVSTPLDLARPGVRIVAAGAAVPITGYADRCIERLAAQPGYPADYATRVAANVVSREDDVAAVRAKIELGEGDAAFVYATDARRASVRTVEIPAAANVTATYAAVRLTSSANSAAAQAFLDWLVSSAEAQGVLRSFGFGPPP